VIERRTRPCLVGDVIPAPDQPTWQFRKSIHRQTGALANVDNPAGQATSDPAKRLGPVQAGTLLGRLL
jgi:hypothetical protein